MNIFTAIGQFFTNWGAKLASTFLEDDRYMMLVEGLRNTAIITRGALCIGIVIGALVAIIKYCGEGNPAMKPLCVLCDIYTTVIRGIPVVVLLLIFYFVIMKSASGSSGGIAVGIVTFGINSGAYDVIILNFANCDMVGHTGGGRAGGGAVETGDECFGRVVEATLKIVGIAMVTSDHVNAEVMLQPDGSPMPAHTTNLVPFILCGAGTQLRPGRLADIAPTILDVMGLAAPQEMDGQTLIVK